jgi:hypothetical protein
MGAVTQIDKRLSKPDAELRLQLSMMGRSFVKHQFQKTGWTSNGETFHLKNKLRLLKEHASGLQETVSAHPHLNLRCGNSTVETQSRHV